MSHEHRALLPYKVLYWFVLNVVPEMVMVEGDEHDPEQGVNVTVADTPWSTTYESVVKLMNMYACVAVTGLGKVDGVPLKLINCGNSPAADPSYTLK